MKMDDEAAEGDLHGRAMPVLDQDDVDALARAVQPILDSDDAIRRWCTRANVERFLRADRGNLAKATKRLTDTLKWRVAERPETRRTRGASGPPTRRDLGKDVHLLRRGQLPRLPLPAGEWLHARGVHLRLRIVHREDVHSAGHGASPRRPHLVHPEGAAVPRARGESERGAPPAGSSATRERASGAAFASIFPPSETRQRRRAKLWPFVSSRGQISSCRVSSNKFTNLPKMQKNRSFETKTFSN